jgi:hypothetical protein
MGEEQFQQQEEQQQQQYVGPVPHPASAAIPSPFLR